MVIEEKKKSENERYLRSDMFGPIVRKSFLKIIL